MAGVSLKRGETVRGNVDLSQGANYEEKISDMHRIRRPPDPVRR